MTDLKTQRTRLLQRLSELDSRLHTIEFELVSHADPDWEEQAAEREDDQMLESMGSKGQQEIARIRAALARMREGSYGVCTKCGNTISAERLEVLPETPFCKSCA